MQQFQQVSTNPGSIICKPISAKLQHDTDWFTKMAPYVVFIIGTQRNKSRVCKGGGKTPTWTDTLTLQRTTEDVLYFEIWDDETFGKNELVAVGEYPVSKLLTAFGYHTNEWVPLYYNKRPAGHINLDLTFQSNNMAGGGIQVGTQQGQFVQQNQFGMQQNQFGTQQNQFGMQQNQFGMQQKTMPQTVTTIQQQPLGTTVIQQQPLTTVVQQPQVQTTTVVQQQPMQTTLVQQQPLTTVVQQQPLIQSQPLQTTVVQQQPMMMTNSAGYGMQPQYQQTQYQQTQYQQPMMQMPMQTMGMQTMGMQTSMPMNVSGGMMTMPMQTMPMQTMPMQTMGMQMQPMGYGMPQETIVIVEEHHKKHHHHHHNQDFW